MKKIFLILVSLFLSPIMVSAMTQDQCFSGGGTSYDSGICSCSGPRVWSGDGCYCPQSNQYWNGSTCVTSSDDDAITRSNCSSILCTAECDWKGTGTCSTTKKVATYSESAGKCMCPTGYSSNEAPTEGGSSNDDDDSDDDSGGTGGSGGAGSGGSTTVTGPTTASTGSITNPIASGTFADLIDMIVKWILDIAMVLAPLVVVYGGITYITAAGRPGKMEEGKKIILYACLGFLLALLASSLINILKGLAGGGS